MSTENLPASRAPQRQADLQDLLAILIAAGLTLVIHQNGTGIPRILLALAFTCYVPGRAIVSNWPGFGRWSAAATPVALSIAVLTIIATASLWAHHWHPLGIFQVEAMISIVLLLMGLIRRQVRHGQGRDYPAPGTAEPAASNGYHRQFDDDQFLDDEYYDEAAEAGWRPRRGREPAARRSRLGDLAGPGDLASRAPEDEPRPGRSGRRPGRQPWRDEHPDGPDEDRWPAEDRRRDDRRRSDPRPDRDHSRGDDRRPAEGLGLEEIRRPRARRRPSDDPPRTDHRPGADRPSRDSRPGDDEPRSDRPPRIRRWATDDRSARNPLPIEDELGRDRPPQARRRPSDDRPARIARPTDDELGSDRPPRTRRRPSDDRRRADRLPGDDRLGYDRLGGDPLPTDDRQAGERPPRADRPRRERPRGERPPGGHPSPEGRD